MPIFTRKYIQLFASAILRYFFFLVSVLFIFLIFEGLLRTLKRNVFSHRHWLEECHFDENHKYVCEITEIPWMEIFWWWLWILICITIIFLAFRKWCSLHKNNRYLKYLLPLASLLLVTGMTIHFFGLTHKTQWQCPQFISGNEICCKYSTGETGSTKRDEHGNVIEISSYGHTTSSFTRLSRCEELQE